MTVQIDGRVLETGRPLPMSAVLTRASDGSAILPAPGATVSVPGRHAASSVAKRILDFFLALILILVLLPLLVVVALAIRLESKGPALFRQRRGGLNGVSFRIYKFRTMRVQEDDHTVSHATRSDRRVTRLGAILRKTSFDELPQLLNVLRGEMSMVGPRPHAVAHDAFYGASVWRYVDRMRVRPGLTGWAQVSGYRGEIADLNAMAMRVSYDLNYVENWSLALDLKLIFLTVVRVPFDRKAY